MDVAGQLAMKEDDWSIAPTGGNCHKIPDIFLLNKSDHKSSTHYITTSKYHLY